MKRPAALHKTCSKCGIVMGRRITKHEASCLGSPLANRTCRGCHSVKTEQKSRMAHEKQCRAFLAMSDPSRSQKDLAQPGGSVNTGTPTHGNPPGKNATRLLEAWLKDQESPAPSAAAVPSKVVRPREETQAVLTNTTDRPGSKRRRLEPERPQVDIFLERQRAAHCGMHALNNAIGGPMFQPEHMRSAMLNIIAETGDDDDQHMRQGGWYSHGHWARTQKPFFPPWYWVLSLTKTTSTGSQFDTIRVSYDC